MFQLYNFKHYSTRICVERAFGFETNLKNPKKTMTKVDLQKIPLLIVVCYILHKIIINKNNIIDEDLILFYHHDEGYTVMIDRTTPEDEFGQLQNKCIF